MQCLKKDKNKQINNCKCEISETKYTFCVQVCLFRKFYAIVWWWSERDNETRSYVTLNRELWWTDYIISKYVPDQHDSSIYI